MKTGLQKLTRHFDEEIKFLKGWIDQPRAVGAMLPTSSFTARRMASVITPESRLPVLELGPGTGVITKAILERGIAPQDLYSIEYSADFVDHLNEQLLELWARTTKTICFVTHSIPEAVYLSTKIVVMSPRPGRVTDVIESTLPKERPLDIRETPEFLAIAARVREGLRAGHSYE